MPKKKKKTRGSRFAWSDTPGEIRIIKRGSKPKDGKKNNPLEGK